MMPTPEKLTEHVFNLCILGSGPAGIMLALEYARIHPRGRVLLVEYGANSLGARNRLDDSIEITNPVNHHPPYECTNKGLGGSSATWGGRCVMYDEVDFLDRPVVQGGCTWDLELFAEVKSHVPRAAEYFECGSGPFSLRDMPAFREARIAEGFIEGDVTDSTVERWSMPTRFGSRYAAELTQADNIAVVTGMEARGFTKPDAEGRIEAAELREVETGRIVSVKAWHFVLAAGAQETTRILLRNPEVFHHLGGPPKALGHYYQGHVSGKIASVRFRGAPQKTDYGFLRDRDGTYFRRRFQLSTKTLCRENLLNTALWLDNPLYFDPKHKSGAMSFMYLAMIMPFLGKRLAPPAIAYSVTKGKVTGIPQHLWNILRGLPGSLVTPVMTFYGRYCRKRKLPGVFLYSPQNHYALHFHAEQVPDEGNRMELAPDGESLVIHYQLSDADVQSVIRVHELLDTWLRRCDCGDLEYWYPREDLPEAIRKMSKDGLHQSGTTRIANSPESGVVDRDLKVWGTANLHVCSSSVFPTSGQANPTFLLGAFAIRLAQHLAQNPCATLN